MKVECAICVEDVYKSSSTTCPFCKINVCQKCVKTYVFDQKSSTVSCMGCKKPWSRSILVQMFGKTFVNNTLNNHIKEVLYMEQKSMIPETLPYIEKFKQRNILNEQNRKDTERLLTLNINTVEYYILLSKIEAVSNFVNNFLSYNRIMNDRHRLETDKQNPTNVYVYPCSNPDCLGHVNSSWHCSMCDGHTCKHCLMFIPQNQEHKCKKEDIDTATLIKKTSKPCPGCKISIVKTAGCDQMWCTKCHITFKWSTGQRDNSNIHNPEYYRWMRENIGYVPRQQGDIVHDPCNDIVAAILQKFRMQRITSGVTVVGQVQQLVYHIDQVHIPKLQNIVNNRTMWYREQRVKLLLKKISDTQFKTNIARKHKEITYNDEELALVTTLRDVLKDTVSYYFNHSDDLIKKIDQNKYLEISQAINKHISVCNEIMKKTKDLYGYKFTKPFKLITLS